MNKLNSHGYQIKNIKCRKNTRSDMCESLVAITSEFNKTKYMSKLWIIITLKQNIIAPASYAIQKTGYLGKLLLVARIFMQKFDQFWNDVIKKLYMIHVWDGFGVHNSPFFKVFCEQWNVILISTTVGINIFTIVFDFFALTCRIWRQKWGNFYN